MTDYNALSDEDFRMEARRFLETHYPEDKRHIIGRARWAEIKEWFFTLSQHGWIAPAWPREHGGMGLSPAKLLAWIEEQERYGAARVPDHGINMVGPTLLQLGTPEQCAHYLPRILTGEHLWAQGYSEPGAGSDLASLRCQAVVEGDTLVINGQKTWSTMAQESTHMYLLVRTDKDAPKHKGISFLLLPLDLPGITVRPIKDIVGESNFCDVFFEDVRVPLANVVGGLNRGWAVAKTQLGFERLMHGSPKMPENLLQRLKEMAVRSGAVDDPAFRSRFTQLEWDVADLRALYARFAEIVRRGDPLPPEVSLLKIWSSETYARIADLGVDAMASAGGLHPKDDTLGANAMVHFYRSRASTIYAGSAEVQRNILAKQLLG
ncbi:acyl-CoA dehydrogenase family protein [uncultured Hydrogenophaga sp.]|uniref:acyl-CoA dehydrogenase family protein n=1 Tax=uncultured Hydrogenophaga sp. TaxID=199683 RepID=UPI00258774E6|nr:acyl-CoA dehydrogenase family protein [uncultured Hydrogenophaga sp.]